MYNILLTKEIEIKLWANNINHYLSLGYQGNINDVIVVKTEDLTPGTSKKVLVTCDYCGKEHEIKYCSYITKLKNNEKIPCSDCINTKRKERNMEKYGYEYTLQVPEIREQIVKTNLDKYGEISYLKTQECRERYIQVCQERYNVDNYFASQEFKDNLKDIVMNKYGVSHVRQLEETKEKYRQTCRERYGYDYPSQSPDIYKKMKDSCFASTGYEYISQSPEVKEKVRQTNKIRYGYDYVLQSPIIREKSVQSLYKYSSQKCSIQQKYLHNLYGGELNYPISYYSADICFPEDKIDFEVDFGGHDLSVKLGTLTQEEFNHKEIVRNNIIKREGYKTIRLISRKDLLPSDPTLLSILSYARQYFSEFPNRSWISFDIDASKVFNAENKAGVFFNFGELRKIKSEDVES